MNKDIIKKIKEIKDVYEQEGFIILGIFGSYARDEESENSDIDILFETTDSFIDRYSGWEIFGKIEDIREEIENEIKKDVHLADKNGLGVIGKKYILPEVLYV